VVASFQDPRINYSPLDSNIGLWGNLSRGFSLGSAPYLSILCDDDFMLPGNLERKVETLDRNPEVSMVHSAFQLLMVHPDQTEELNENVNHVHGSIDRIDPGDAVIRHLLTESYFLNFSGAAIRRSLVGDERFDAREGAAADLGVCLRIARKGAIAFLAEPLVVYRLHPGAGSVQDGVWEFETGAYQPTLASIAETKRPKKVFLATYGREMTDLREVKSASRRYALKALLYVLKLKSDPTRSRRERFGVLWDAVRIDASILLKRPAIRYLASTVLGSRGLKLARHVARRDRKDSEPSRDTSVR
jgi:hypothetical protein